VTFPKPGSFRCALLLPAYSAAFWSGRFTFGVKGKNWIWIERAHSGPTCISQSALAGGTQTHSIWVSGHGPGFGFPWIFFVT